MPGAGAEALRPKKEAAPKDGFGAALFWVSGRLIDYIAGHAWGEGQPLSEHRIALRPLPLTLAEVVGVLHVAKGGITGD